VDSSARFWETERTRIFTGYSPFGSAPSLLSPSKHSKKGSDPFRFDPFSQPNTLLKKRDRGGMTSAPYFIKRKQTGFQSRTPATPDHFSPGGQELSRRLANFGHGPSIFPRVRRKLPTPSGPLPAPRKLKTRALPCSVWPTRKRGMAKKLARKGSGSGVI